MMEREQLMQWSDLVSARVQQHPMFHDEEFLAMVTQDLNSTLDAVGHDLHSAPEEVLLVALATLASTMQTVAISVKRMPHPDGTSHLGMVVAAGALVVYRTMQARGMAPSASR